MGPLHFVPVVLCLSILVQSEAAVDPSICRVQKKCRDCQLAHPLCNWCSNVPFSGPRCDTRDNLVAAGCYRVENIRSYITPKTSDALSSVVSVTPQRVTAVVYKARPATFTVQAQIPRRSRLDRLTLRVKNPPNFADISITSDCRRSRGSGNRVVCPGLEPGSTANFTVTVAVNSCTRKAVNRVILKVSNVRGSVRIDLKDKCECACEFFSILASTDSSEYCHYNGEVRCGLCECYNGYQGDLCQCSESDTRERCVPSGSTELCSGHGKCICGVCDCSQNPISNNLTYHGQYCECDDSTCPVYEDQVCGGSSRGRCACGECVCQPGFSGTGCEIREQDTSNCISSDGSLCNRNGRCIDGQCECQGLYTGVTCEECSTCQSRCESILTCVQCRMFQTGPLTTDECQAQCSALDLIFVDNIEDTNIGRKICEKRSDDNEAINYVYLYAADGSMQILVNRNATM